MASVYEEMADEMEGAEEDDAEMADAEPVEAEAELDGEFSMLAEKLGFSGDKAETFKKAIERCVQLREEGGYVGPVEGEEDEEI